MLSRFLFISLAAACLTGCAFGSKVDYSQIYPQVGAKPAKIIEVAVVDERAYVLNGSKTANYVGLVRGSYYIPYDVKTRSGESLAHDLQQSIIGGIKQAGGTAEAVASPSAQASSTGRQLLTVRIKEWKSEVFMGTVLTYVLAVDVYDEAGQRLASSPVSGSEGVGDYTVTGKSILTRLLAAESVASVLSGSVAAADVPAAELPAAQRAPLPLFVPRGVGDGVF
ncbi:MAG: hypothetical protein Q7J43_11955 [Pseudomonas sp.]|uniref:hypothetical protein n=1 Tax=Pseudomonas sp. TaxID=306 RepID=UPI0027252D7A|nr:hypothetical protein [Pseudomonas sp.]MDO9618383.1 hypothetical protein [Pseudomonas sp.]MDP2446002.1 hypothetical protein [Pseudomonas sp.]MDZ4337773.1 hypothetical protein [Pseudomonas sp.]